MDGDEQEVRMSPYYSPHDQNSSSIMYLTGTYPELDELRLRLLGLNKDEDGNEKQIAKPLCNEEGAHKLVGLAASLATKHGILTHQDDRMIMSLMRNYSKTVRYALMTKRVDWAIDMHDRDMILEMVTDLPYTVLQRGFKGGDRGFWKGSQQEQVMRVEQPQSGGGMFSRLKPWK